MFLCVFSHHILLDLAVGDRNTDGNFFCWGDTEVMRVKPAENRTSREPLIHLQRQFKVTVLPSVAYVEVYLICVLIETFCIWSLQAVETLYYFGKFLHRWRHKDSEKHSDYSAALVMISLTSVKVWNISDGFCVGVDGPDGKWESAGEFSSNVSIYTWGWKPVRSHFTGGIVIKWHLHLSSFSFNGFPAALKHIFTSNCLLYLSLEQPEY